MTLTELDQGLPSNHSDRTKSLLDYSLTRRGLFKASATASALAALSACRIDLGPKVPNTPEKKFSEIWSRPVGPLDQLLVDQSGLFLGSDTPEVIKIGLANGQVLARGPINGGNLIGLKDQNLYVANLNRSTKNIASSQIAVIDKETLQLRWKGRATSAGLVLSPDCYSYKNRLAVDYFGTTVYEADSGKILAEPRPSLFYRSNASWSPDFMQLDENNKWLVAPIQNDSRILALTERLIPKPAIPASDYLQTTFKQDQLFNMDTLDFEKSMPKYEYDMEVFGVERRSVLYNLSTRTGPAGVVAVDIDSKKQKWFQKDWELIQRSDSVAIARLDVDDSSALLAGFDIESGSKIWEEKVKPDLGLTRVGDQFYGIQTLVKKEADGLGAKAVWYLNLLKLNHQTGKIDWSTTVDGDLTSGLSLRGEVEMVPAKRRLGWLDNQYFVVANERNVYLLSSGSGKMLGKAEFLEPMPMSFYKKNVSVSEVVRPQSAATSDREVFMGLGSHLFVLDKSQGSLRLKRHYGPNTVSLGSPRITGVEAIGRQLFVRVNGLPQSTIYCYQTG